MRGCGRTYLPTPAEVFQYDNHIIPSMLIALVQINLYWPGQVLHFLALAVVFKMFYARQ